MSSQSLVHPNKLSGSPVKYLIWSLGGKMLKHYSCELRGTEKRQRDREKSWKSISRLKPAGHVEGSNVSIRMQMGAQLEFMQTSKQAKDMNWRANSRGEHLLLLFASAECRSLCILHMKLQFLTSRDLLRQAKDPNLQKANKQKTLNVSFIHKSNSKLENKIYGPPCIGENYTKSNYIVKLGLV